ncbi:predicted protein [Uncinocarpus reesii 1704]|uniref:Uncharacterized protein n=1 Tax=Uncinocarpus reesii (strain UAMH 1704) TaxID=336963 RepID=C4JHF0_UNCRE|nr:uncharacterized protein UREG_01313 [Uncinocarpus reesii 1704]EEP76464.1 predicted protein [Uncinocarpus reesii 1704]
MEMKMEATSPPSAELGPPEASEPLAATNPPNTERIPVPSYLEIRIALEPRCTLSASDIHEPGRYLVVYPPPLQEGGVSDYGKEEIRALLAYAIGALECKWVPMSPMGRRAMKTLKRACEQFLRIESERKQFNFKLAAKQLKEVIAFMDSGLREAPYGLLPSDLVDKTLQIGLIELYKASFWARYGEMLTTLGTDLGCEKEIDKLRLSVASVKTDWVHIDRCIQGENKDFASGHLPEDECVVYNRIMKACNSTGFEADETFYMIHNWAIGDGLVQPDLIDLIKGAEEDNPFYLARRVYFDIWDCPMIVPPEEETCLSILRELLEACRNTWFDCNSSPDDYSIWPPSWHLAEFLGYQDEERRLNLPDDDQLREEIYSNILRETKKQLLNSARCYFPCLEDYGQFEQFSWGCGNISSECPLEQAEIEKAQKLARDWQRVERLVHGVGQSWDIRFETMDGVFEVEEGFRHQIISSFQGNPEIDYWATW